MKLPHVCLLAAAALPAASAWVAVSPVTAALQRAAATAATAALIATGAPLAASAGDMAAAPFAGSYADPFHPNCQRVVAAGAGPSAATLTGTDGNPGCPADGSGKSWTLSGRIDGNNLLVDFSPKGGPKDLKGVWDGDGIKWPDGNKWTLKATASAQ